MSHSSWITVVAFSCQMKYCGILCYKNYDLCQLMICHQQVMAHKGSWDVTLLLEMHCTTILSTRNAIHHNPQSPLPIRFIWNLLLTNSSVLNFLYFCHTKGLSLRTRVNRKLKTQLMSHFESMLHIVLHICYVCV